MAANRGDPICDFADKHDIKRLAASNIRSVEDSDLCHEVDTTTLDQLRVLLRIEVDLTELPEELRTVLAIALISSVD